MSLFEIMCRISRKPEWFMMDVNIIAMYFLVSCAPLSLPNGLVNYTKSLENGRYPVDTVASFACNSGYYENGTNLRTCQASLNWSGQTPICEGYFLLILQIYFLSSGKRNITN